MDNLDITADFSAKAANLSLEELPQCKSCFGLLRPDIVWFGESLDSENLEIAFQESKNAELILVIGTSSQLRVFIELIVDLCMQLDQVNDFKTPL